MPLTPFQLSVLRLLAKNRSPDSYLAGGAAMNFSPQSHRYSNDLDFFHDSAERVASAFQEDSALLGSHGYTIAMKMNQPGFIRAVVSKGENSTKIEWSHDSAWRFMPTVYDPDCGYQLHPIDNAINKTLALAGRIEPRDFLDVLYLHREVLPLGALCWAAAGKDPGFTPASLLEILRRRGKFQEEDFRRVMLNTKIDMVQIKQEWLSALESAERFIERRPADEIGCLYFDPQSQRFVAPDETCPSPQLHWGTPGGVIPKVASTESEQG